MTQMQYTERDANYREPITTVLGKARQRRGWDRQELARESNVWRSRLYRLELRNGRASLADREAIGQALGRDASELFDADGRAIKLQGVAR